VTVCFLLAEAQGADKWPRPHNFLRYELCV
jgi:hypothetical protein